MGETDPPRLQETVDGGRLEEKDDNGCIRGEAMAGI